MGDTLELDPSAPAKAANASRVGAEAAAASGVTGGAAAGSSAGGVLVGGSTTLQLATTLRTSPLPPGHAHIRPSWQAQVRLHSSSSNTSPTVSCRTSPARKYPPFERIGPTPSSVHSTVPSARRRRRPCLREICMLRTPIAVGAWGSTSRPKMSIESGLRESRSGATPADGMNTTGAHWTVPATAIRARRSALMAGRSVDV